MINKISKYFLIQIEVNENEMIYIPEGWWHQVQTVGEDNLAFNFWWDKTNLLLDHNKELFLIKHSVSNLVEKKIKSLYKINVKKSAYKKYRMVSLKKLLEKNDLKKNLA
jgi:oxalate decarboxylase/phosphoglucose isomerase-like protein (cupin superfamily)